VREEPRQAFRRDVAAHTLRVPAPAGDLQNLLVDVGGEDLHLRQHAADACHFLREQDGQRVHLLATGAADHPHPHLVPFPLSLEQAGKRPLRQRVEGVVVMEERRHADQDLLEDLRGFAGIVLEPLRYASGEVICRASMRRLIRRTRDLPL